MRFFFLYKACEQYVTNCILINFVSFNVETYSRSCVEIQGKNALNQLKSLVQTTSKENATECSQSMAKYMVSGSQLE